MEGLPPSVRNEARAAAALNHPNVCTVHGVDDSEGVLMIVMEHVEGRSLADVLVGGPLAAGRVREIGRQIASGMAMAHAKGVVHGDLKPANILLSGGDTVKIVDFGLAGRHRITHSGDSTRSLAGEGTVAGTPAYMSPEQADGGAASRQGDIFALGLILYDLLTATRSFEGRNLLEILETIRSTDPEACAAAVDEPFRSLLRRMLVRDPKERTITI